MLNKIKVLTHSFKEVLKSFDMKILNKKGLYEVGVRDIKIELKMARAKKNLLAALLSLQRCMHVVNNDVFIWSILVLVI